MPFDIGAGLLLGLGTASVLGLENPLILAVVGVMFALLPDLDFIYCLLSPRGRRRISRHRQILHRPLVYIPLGCIAVLFMGREWLLLFVLCSGAHFLHDSIGIGWGVQWLFPFSRKSFSFLYHLQNNIGKPTIHRRLLYIWPDDSIDRLAETYGDEHWIKNIYGRAHPYALIEVAVLLAGLVALYIAVRGAY